jgi:hypothetical protein
MALADLLIKIACNLIPRTSAKSLKKRSQDKHFGAFQQEIFRIRKHTITFLVRFLVTAVFTFVGFSQRSSLWPVVLLLLVFC